MNCTIFSNIFDKKPNIITIDVALSRIVNGKSKDKVEAIRKATDKEQAQNLKKQLPSVCFSGEFNERKDEKIINHSGFIVLDFDNVEDIGEKCAYLSNFDFVYACWVSPSGNGVKALVRIADGKKHRLHFNALKEQFKEVDASGVNESRVCYESYDPHMYINKDAKQFTKTVDTEKIPERIAVTDEKKIFDNILTWQTKQGGAFVKGQRNLFFFKLAGACCRFGISEDNAKYLIISEYPTSSEFTTNEANATIKSAYRSNSGSFGTAVFENERLVDKTTRREVSIKDKDFDITEPAKDVIYGSEVKHKAVELYNKGYISAKGIYTEKFDYHFRAKIGEITLLSGMGNSGKSTLFKWFVLMRIMLYGEKFAVYGPEDNPAEEFYHDFVEMLLKQSCIPENPLRPSIEVYKNAYDFVSSHVFYVYPKDTRTTPEYIMERFLELIIKEKVSGVCIDPHNQLAHDYNSQGRTDLYLEEVFGNYARFAQDNSVMFFIIAHPTKMGKDATGNYICPDVYDMAGGAMWSAKMDNILIYHRPFGQTDANNPTCEFHAKKIRRQKTVGKRGFVVFSYDYKKRRFEFDGVDSMQDVINANKLDFHAPVKNYKPYDMESKQIPITP